MFEQIYSPRWLIKNPRYGYLLGLVFAIFGIFSAKLIFGSNPGMMSVAFTSILIMPLLNSILSKTESKEIREKKFSIYLLFKDHGDIFRIYTYIFLGIMTTYAFFTLVWSSTFSIGMFGPQLKVAGFAGGAFQASRFSSILLNNMIVLLVCFLLSFFYGAGSILFISWNASVWGSVFGYLARQSAVTTNANPFLCFITLIIPVLPHLITEAASYFSAAIVGGVVSKAVIKEKWMSRKFQHVLTDAMLFFLMAAVLVVIAAYIEVHMFPWLRSSFGLPRLC